MFFLPRFLWQGQPYARNKVHIIPHPDSFLKGAFRQLATGRVTSINSTVRDDGSLSLWDLSSIIKHTLPLVEIIYHYKSQGHKSEESQRLIYKRICCQHRIDPHQTNKNVECSSGVNTFSLQKSFCLMLTFVCCKHALLLCKIKSHPLPSQTFYLFHWIIL